METMSPCALMHVSPATQGGTRSELGCIACGALPRASTTYEARTSLPVLVGTHVSACHRSNTALRSTRDRTWDTVLYGEKTGLSMPPGISTSQTATPPAAAASPH